MMLDELLDDMLKLLQHIQEEVDILNMEKDTVVLENEQLRDRLNSK